MKQLWRYFLIVVGCISFALGMLGVFLPLLPTTPFMLLTGVCFVNSSDKFHGWLVSNKIYKSYVGEYLKTRTISLKKKFKILTSIYIMVGISIYFAPMLLIRYGLILMLVTQTIILFVFIPSKERNRAEVLEEFDVENEE